MPAKGYDPFRIRPVAGFLDLRSDPSDVPVGGYRWAQNVRVTQKYRMCRMSGWTKFAGTNPVFNNSDYHDQLDYNRQHITTLFEAEYASGFSKLFTGMQNRVSAINNWTDNYKVISDTLGGTVEAGCSEKRWSIASLDRTVVMTNNADEPVYHIIDQPNNEDGEQSVKTIPDLVTLNITKVGLVLAWSNLMFYMNVVQDGIRYANRIIWSDYKRPISLMPDENVSLAGNIDLESGESILAAGENAGTLWVYTTHRIWEITASGNSAAPISYRKRYSPKTPGLRCLAYPNTLVSTGTDQYYWGSDGIYAMSVYDSEPRLVDWIHRASSRIFDSGNLNKQRCKMPCGGYNSARKEIWWSWGKEDETCNSETFIINTEFPFSQYVDHGFSAFCNASPDRLMSLRQWMIDQCICSITELIDAGQNNPKEGGLCYAETQPACDNQPANFFSSTGITIDEEEEVEAEDCSLDPDSDSLYVLLGATTIEDVCGAEFTADTCNSEKVFLMVSTADQCIKQDGDIMYREQCSDTEGCGTYVREGYRTLLRSGPMSMGFPDDDKVISRFVIDAETQAESVPSTMSVRIGAAARPLDPNLAADKCVIRWFDSDDVVLECLDQVNAAQHEDENTRPDSDIEFQFYVEGRWIYFEIEIFNDDTTPEDQGGLVCWSEYRLYAAGDERSF